MRQLNHLTFTVVGIPAPQGSKRHVGRGIMVESSKRVKPWRQDVKAAAIDAADAADWRAPLTPVHVALVFHLPRPRGHYGTGRNAGQLRTLAPAYPAVRPDLDKLVRSTMDALTEAGVIRDDAHVVSINARKLYADTIRPGVTVVVES